MLIRSAWAVAFASKARVVFLVMATALPAGCAAHTSAPSTSPSVPQAPVFNKSSASFRTPVEVFGMTSAEVRIIHASNAVRIVRCATNSVPSPAQIREIEDSLKPVLPSIMGNHWTFGPWDADFIEQYGWEPHDTQPVEYRLGIDAQEVARCRGELDSLVDPITAQTTSHPSLISEIYFSSYYGAMESADARPLLARLAECSKEHFLDLDSHGLVFGEDNRTEFNRKVLIRAKCSDQTNYVQGMALLQSSLQVAAISRNIDELESIHTISRSRVREAMGLV